MTLYLLAIFVTAVVLLLVAFWYRIAHGMSLWGSIQKANPLIIFDFDGTICPSYPLFIDQVNHLADEYHLRKIEPNEIEDFRNMTPKAIMTTFNVSIFKLPFLLKKARHNVQNQILELQPVSGIKEVLHELKLQGYSLGILTSNSLTNVLRYLKKYDLELFDFIYSANNVFGKEKHLKTALLHK